MKKVLTITLLVLLTVGLFISCNADAVEKIFNNDQSKVFTVTFNTNGGSTIASQTVKEGEKATKPTDNPTKDGYSFDKWYSDSGLTTVYNFDTPVTENITIYAKWTLNPSTIANLLPDGFPESKETSNWKNGTNKVYLSGQNLTFETEGLESSYAIPTSGEVTPSGSDYTITAGDGNLSATLKFTMNGGELQSIDITFSGLTASSKDTLKGTYSVPKTFKAVYNTSSDANTLTFYYDAVDHSGENITVYEDGTENYLFDDSRSTNSKWGYNSNSTNIKSVAIDSSVANYTGLTYTAYMFFNMTNASSITGAEYLDVSNVTDMSYMFGSFGKNSQTLNVVPNVSNWNTSKVQNMGDVFSAYGYGSKVLNAVPNVSGWNTAEVTTMIRMFNEYGYSSTVLDKVPNVSGSNWDTSKVTIMSNIFKNYGHNSESLNDVPDVSNWNTAKVEKMDFLFSYYGYSSEALNAVPDVSNWKTENVKDISNIFQEYGYSSTALTSVPDVSNWKTNNVTKSQSLFNKYGYTSTKLNFTLNLSGWSVANLKGSSDQGYGGMFDYAGNSTSTWSVTIPAKTGDRENNATHWYVGDGTNENNFIQPVSGKQFTLAKIVADILATVPGSFPSSAGQSAWENGNGAKMYVNNNALYAWIYLGQSYTNLACSTVLEKVDENTYTCVDSNYAATWKFTMSNGVLQNVTISGGNSYVNTLLKGTYAPVYTVTFDLNGIEGTAPTPQTVEKDGTVSKPTENLPTLENHTLRWFTKAATSNLSDKWDFDTPVTEDITLYAQWTRTMQSICDTNSEIPKSDSGVPDNAWVNNLNNECKAYINLDFDSFDVVDSDDYSPSININMNDQFIKVDDKYEVVPDEGYKATCNMESGKFVSFIYEDTYPGYEILTGTYAPPTT